MSWARMSSTRYLGTDGSEGHGIECMCPLQKAGGKGKAGQRTLMSDVYYDGVVFDSSRYLWGLRPRQSDSRTAAVGRRERG